MISSILGSNDVACFYRLVFDPVQAFADVYGKPVDSVTASLILKDSDLVRRLQNNLVNSKNILGIMGKLKQIVTTRHANAFRLTGHYLFDGLVSVPSKQESTCLQYVVEGSMLRVAKTSSKADLKNEYDALNRIHEHHSHCPTIVPLLDFVQSDEDRYSLILPHFGLSVAQLNGSGVPDMAELHANVAMCGLATIMACSHVGLCHGDIKPANMMLTDSGVVVTIDFGVTSAYNTLTLGSTNYFGMDATPVTLQYDLACLASSLLLFVKPELSNLKTTAVQNAYKDSRVLAERLAALLVGSSGDLDALWAACKDTIEELTTNKQRLLVYDDLKPIIRVQTST